MEAKQVKNKLIVPISRALFTFLIVIWTSGSAMADSESPGSVSQETSTWQLIKSKLRFRTFTEFMAPAALSNSPTQIPEPDGSSAAPTNVFNIAWMDYEIAENYRILYWQRFTVNLASGGALTGVNTIARNPRFALRRTNVFSNPNISSTYDIYIQPGITPEAISAGRNFEFGFRTNTSYSAPSSRLSFGAITEFTVSLSSKSGPSDRANIYGWAMPWVSYKLNKLFSTEHYLTINFQHKEGKPLQSIELDTYLPYIQNGIGITLSEQFWAAVFVNNYLIAPPSLQNTWASVWLAMNIL
jgi:hypothetical protein